VLRAVDPRHVSVAVPDLNGKPVYVLFCFVNGSVIVRRLNFMDANEMAVLTYDIDPVIHLCAPRRKRNPLPTNRCELHGVKFGTVHNRK
jgi:hypothetical protein